MKWLSSGYYYQCHEAVNVTETTRGKNIQKAWLGLADGTPPPHDQTENRIAKWAALKLLTLYKSQLAHKREMKWKGIQLVGEQIFNLNLQPCERGEGGEQHEEWCLRLPNSRRLYKTHVLQNIIMKRSLSLGRASESRKSLISLPVSSQNSLKVCNRCINKNKSK